MSDFDGAVERPSAEGPDAGSPVGAADAGPGSPRSSAESAVGMEESPVADTGDTGVESAPESGIIDTEPFGEERGLTEDQVLGRASLPETDT